MANGGFDDIFAELTSVNAEVVLLSERVTVLEEAQPAGAESAGGDADKHRPPGSAIVWEDLDDDEYAVLWPQFVHWVIWIADRRELTTDQLPRLCWRLHEAVVDELTALWTGHQSAYAAVTEDAGSGPYQWQTAFASAIERFGPMWLGTCRNGQHKPRHRQRWAGDDQYVTTLLQSGRARPSGDACGDEMGHGHGPDTTDSPDHP